MTFTYLESYNDHQKIIHSVYSSRLKVQILLALLNSQSSLSELREITGSTSQALIPKIRLLESQMLINSKNYSFSLTPLGMAVADNIANYVHIMAGIDKHREFWRTHDLSGLPAGSLKMIGDLRNSEVESNTQVDILHVYSRFLKIVKEGEYIHGISSIMSPGIADVVAARISGGTEVEIVINDEVLSTIRREPYLSQVKRLAKFPNFKVFLLEEPLRLGITVTNEHLSLGLYKLNSDRYDCSSDLFSRDPRAIAWGEYVFGYYRDKAASLNLKRAFASRK
ncbi:MAG TPA: transcriptional regulator FilR1 domain-containing protein [Methanoregulaceae archaeon]|nr:transcriptional regulator FilR1 domain-containing protein [Methanoregulaceae archaeon]